MTLQAQRSGPPGAPAPQDPSAIPSIRRGRRRVGGCGSSPGVRRQPNRATRTVSCEMNGLLRPRRIGSATRCSTSLRRPPSSVLLFFGVNKHLHLHGARPITVWRAGVGDMTRPETMLPCAPSLLLVFQQEIGKISPGPPWNVCSQKRRVCTHMILTLRCMAGSAKIYPNVFASQGCGSATRFRDCHTKKKIKKTCSHLVTWRSGPPAGIKHKICASPITRNVGPCS